MYNSFTIYTYFLKLLAGKNIRQPFKVYTDLDLLLHFKITGLDLDLYNFFWKQQKWISLLNSADSNCLGNSWINVNVQDLSRCHIFIFRMEWHKSNSNTQLNSDLAKISKWAFQWKMSLNPDPNKQAIEVCFSNMTKEITLLCILTLQTSR